MRTLKIAVVLMSVLFFVPYGYAFLDDNSEQQNQGQLQGQIGINELDSDISNRNTNTNFNSDFNSNEQGQGQQQGIDSDISNRTTNMNTDFVNQGQDQGQGQGQAMGQGQQADIDIEDNRETVGYYLAAPNTAAESGQRASSMYSIFGGLNLAQTEEAKQCMDLINVIGQMQTAEYLSKEEARVEALAIFNQLKNATGSKRVLGILWKTRGNHLFNGFGLLACDDLWGKGGKGEKPERADTDLTSGNRGNVGP